MVQSGEFDVVVIGLGACGEVAATAAAMAGLSVQVLERRVVSQPSEYAARLLRMAEHGVDVRQGTTAHELVVEMGRIRGVGFARHAGDEVGCVTAATVVLALGRRHWEFVGPAAWEVGRSYRPSLASVGAGVSPPSSGSCGPEQRVRQWCASQESGQVADAPAELEIDRLTGALRDAGGHAIPGLYAVGRRVQAEGLAAALATDVRGDTATQDAFQRRELELVV